MILILLPALLGLLSFLIRPAWLSRGLLRVTAVTHTVFTVWAIGHRTMLQPTAGFGLDALGAVFLLVTSILFLGVVLAAGNLWEHSHERTLSPAIFTGMMLLFLAAMTATCLAQHVGWFWVAVEATTLASTPLITFHHRPSALEATWKYLLICSVGIALALLGNIVLALAAHAGDGVEHLPLTFSVLRKAGPLLAEGPLQIAFVFFLVGYGTKMGLAPMHTWLPDAHSEAPSPVSALLSGALLSCAFLGIMRLYTVCRVAGAAVFAGRALMALGLLSLLVAAVYIVHQRGYKRMLAYSSIEHMGILALGLGLGPKAGFALVFHVVNHGLIKAALFLSAGSILHHYGTKEIVSVTALRQRLPWTGALWLAGFLAICGTPPFGTFFSEWLILKAALDTAPWPVAVFYLMFLTVIFVGMSRHVFAMAFGQAAGEVTASVREPIQAWLVPLIFLGLALGLGLALPAPLRQLLESAAQYLEVSP